jgi:N-acylneuraminate-9-phosphatase
MIKTLFLDFDHTLADTTGADVQAFASTATFLELLMPGVDSSAVTTAFSDLIETQPWDPQEIIPADVWRTDLWSQALRQNDCTDDELPGKLYDHFYTRRVTEMRWFEGVEAMLAILRRKYTLVIITNGDPIIQRPKLAACDAASAVDHIIISGEQPLAKPNPEIFETAAGLAGCEVSEAIHVGDSLATDIQGGINAGVAATVLVQDGPTPAPSPAPVPDYEIALVTQLPDVLERIEGAR